MVWAGVTLAAFGATFVCFGRWVALAVVVVTAFALVRSASRGVETIDFQFTNIADDLAMPTLRFVLAMSPIWAPAYFLRDQLPHWAELLIDVVAIVWAPFSFIGAATHSPILAVLNPLVMASVVRQVGRDAVTYIITSWLLMVAGVGLAAAAAVLMVSSLPLLLKPLLALALVLWPVVTYARLAGLVVQLHPEPFGGVAEDGYEPVLGETRPRGKWVERAATAPTASAAPGGYQGSSPSAAFSVSSSSGIRGAPVSVEPAVDPRAQFLQALASKNVDVLAAAAKAPPLDLSIKEYLAAGRLLAAHQRNTEAEPLLERAAGCQGEPVEQAEARVIWARFLAERAGAPDMAKEWFTHVVNNFPQTAAAGYAQRWLDANP